LCVWGNAVSACAIKIAAIVWSLAFSAAATKPADDVSALESLIDKGQYDKAVRVAESLAARPDASPRVHSIRIDLAVRLGRYGEAGRIAKALPAKVRSTSDVVIASARLDIAEGRYENAVEQLRPLLFRDARKLQAQANLGRALWLSGKKAEAVRVLRRLSKSWNRIGEVSAKKMNVPDVVAIAEGLSLLSILASDPSQAEAALNDVLVPAMKLWPEDARLLLASAGVLASRYNFAEAVGDLKKALKRNPSNPRSLTMLASTKFEQHSIKDAREYARKALIYNPALPEANVVLAWVELIEEDFGGAASYAAKALKINPRLLEALALKSACLELTGRSREAEAVRAAMPDGKALLARFCVARGTAFMLLRRFGMAEKAFSEACALDGNFAGANRLLGLSLWLRGEEAAAYTSLSRAHRIDPYDVRTFNLLELADWMRKNLVEAKVGSVSLKVYKRDDAVLRPLYSRAIKQVFSDLTAIYDFRPGAAYVEVFPDHRRFSVRTSGQTWIATVGACTGPVVAMFRPRIKQKGLNWRRILRHEMTHVVNLVETRYRVPHWFTEGCAVYEEFRGVAGRPTRWLHRLDHRLRSKGELIPIKDLSASFVRPETFAERDLAYFQALLAVETMVETAGFDCVVGALRDFASCEDFEAVSRKRLKMSSEDFDRRLLAHARSLLAETLVLGGGDLKEVKAAEDKACRDPRSARAQCDYAEAVARLSVTRAVPPKTLIAAVKAADSAAKDPKTSFAARRAKAWLRLAAKKTEEAKGAFESALKEKEDPECLVGLARVLAAGKKPEDAVALLGRAHEKKRLTPDVCLWASKLASKAAKTDLAMLWLKRYLETAPDDRTSAMRYGRYAMKSGRVKEAAWAFGTALDLDPFSVDAYIGLGEALLGAGCADEAVFYLELAGKADTHDPTAAAMLAKAYAAAGRGKEAAGMARKALSLGAEAETVRAILDKAGEKE